MQETTTASDNYESNIECLADIYVMLNGAEFPLCSGLTTEHNIQVSPVLLFPDRIIRLNSDHSDWREVSKQSQWDLTNYERLISISRSQIDDFIESTTELDSLQELIEEAVSHYLGSSEKKEIAGGGIK
jgi:hypothetical protein